MTVWYAGRNEIPTCIPDGHIHRVTYTRCRIATIDSPDDRHIAVGLNLISACIPDSHLNRVIYTRSRIDTIDSPDDGHIAARNM